MIPATFDYEVADSAAHALSLLAEHGEDAKLLAGGHSLLPMMKVRLAQPAVLVDIARVGELSGIRSEGDELVIGATTRHADVAGSDLVSTLALTSAFRLLRLKGRRRICLSTNIRATLVTTNSN